MVEEQRNRTWPVTILMAEDDDEDYELCVEVFTACSQRVHLQRARDGEELLDYLFHRGAFAPPVTVPSPALILLDLNMPKKDGRDALAEIKAHPQLRRIPIIVLTTSKADTDILKSYHLGVAAYIRKPDGYTNLRNVVQAIYTLWFDIAELPPAI
jgi:CheY-like chemotaxis protein